MNTVVQYFDRKGQPISEKQFNAYLRNPEYCRVAVSDFDQWRVATYWFGASVDEGLGHRDIFETVLIHDGHGEVYVLTVATEAQAEEHHRQVLASLLAGETPTSRVEARRGRTVYPPRSDTPLLWKTLRELCIGIGGALLISGLVWLLITWIGGSP